MTDYAANLAFYLLEKTGNVCGKWTGRMTAKEQRTLMGQYMGKGTLVINGEDETVKHRVQTCFGLDSEVTARATWRELCEGKDALAIYVRDGKPSRG